MAPQCSIFKIFFALTTFYIHSNLLIRVNPDKTSVTEHLFLVHEYISEYITGVNQFKIFKACYLPIDTYTRVEHIEECRLTRLACTVLSMSQGTPKENVFIQQRQSCHIKSP